MRLFMNDVPTELFPETYIKWNETDTDTIKASYGRGENFVICNKVWLNNRVVWDFNSPPGISGRNITITK